ncbi:MAG: tRNA uridine-5-carboxymethylaminomethyl(34) synthesis GTPase MnmE [Betaproteobacteria bacterium]|nr:tRNA uridine-5-carboxymethylaminomethyl(34) synthesis GTPase MnmE [Betaproteobacteria bacterium]
MSPTDLIFAQSSAKGRSALALIRISGKGCLQKIERYLRRAVSTTTGTELSSDALVLKHALARYGFLVDVDGTIIDDCLFNFFGEPFSYTGEDTLEISSHGNPYIVARIQALLRRIGMRDAEPGEFTQRAYLNGKLDLTRAEAIDQLIHADTAAGVALARKATSGIIATHTHELREQLIKIMAYFEAHIDFAEDEVGSYDAVSQKQQLELIHVKVRSLADSYASGMKMREGLKVVFLGEPNAGKSSLYNALLGTERAIVTAIPGTTRDVVEDRLLINGKDFVLLDTAGVRETHDQIEKIGVERTLRAAKEADILCYVIDPVHMNASALELELKQKISELKASAQTNKSGAELIVLTKSDLWPSALSERINELSRQSDAHVPPITLSSSQTATVGDVRKLFEKIYDATLVAGRNSDSPVLISRRQQDKALLALGAVEHAIDMVARGDFPEKIASTLVLASQHLTELVGEIGTEDVLANIFSSFCIGK